MPISDAVRQLIARGPLAHVVTLNADGSPHVSLAWVGVEDDEVVIGTIPDQVKLRNLRRFLEEGDKAKVTLRFRGREMAHQELGMRVLERVRDDLTELAQVEAMPKLEGRQMVMVLAPKKKAVGKVEATT